MKADPRGGEGARRALSLAFRVFSGLVPTTILLIGMLGLANYYVAKRQILRGIEREIAILSREAADLLATFFSQRREDAVALGEAPLLRDYLKNRDYGLLQEAESYRKELAGYYAQFARRSGVYSRIAYVDAQGYEKAVGTPSAAPEPSPLPRLLESRTAKRGEVFNTGIRPGEDQAVDYWTGVYDDDGRPVGNVVLTCELREVSSLLQRMRVGSAGRAFLVDSGGRELLATKPYFPDAVAAETAIAGTPWKVKLMAKPGEFLAPLRDVERWSWLACLVSGLLLTLWIAYWSRKVSQPIEEMAEGTRKIAGGDLDFRFAPPPIRELTILGNAFNDMTRSLKERNSELEARIRELSALREMEGAVIQRLDEETILRSSLKAIVKGLALDRAGLYWIDGQKREIRGRYTFGAQVEGMSEQLFQKRRIPLNEQDIINEVIRTRASVCLKEPLKADSRLKREYVEESKTLEFVMAPICGKDEVFGVIVADNCSSRRPLTESDKEGLTLFAHAVGLAIENSTLFQHVAESEARYRTVLENSPVAVLGISGQQWITTWNLGAEHIFGYKAGEILGKPLRALFGRVSGDEFTGLLSAVMEKGAVRDYAIMGATKEGRPLDLSLSWGGALADFWLNKEWTVVIRDVTESKKLQQQVIRSEKLSAIGQLISGITHELNNPLQAVVGYAQLLSREGKTAFHDDVRLILDSAMRCRKIIENLLVFVRQGKVEMRPVRVGQAVRASLVLLQYKLKKAQAVRVTAELPKDLPKVRADFQQLQQVLVNLINNACDAMAAAGGPKKLAIRAFERGGVVRVEVADSGPGIPPEVGERVFEPFFSTKAEGRGTGLGLAICRQIINDHGGRIDFDSSPGEGTTFWLELPAEREDRRLLTKKPAAVPRVGGKSILVVDDEAFILGFLRRIFEKDGHRVDSASSWKAAAEKSSRMRYDLVVADVQLGDGTGLDFHENWSRYSAHERPPFLFVSGDVLNTGLQQALAQRGLSLLNKPVDVQDLRRAAYGLLIKKTHA